jgi:transposase
MRDKDLYSQILGIKTPWFVEDVNLDIVANKVEVFIALQADAVLTCPHCGAASPRYDKRERRWRHLDTCQMQTLLVAEVPRVNCATHGVTQMAVAWAEPGSGYTALFESLVIDWLKITTTEALRLRLNLSWNAVDGIMQRAVARGLARRETLSPTRLSVDETSFQKRHEYVTVVTDQDTARVLYVADDRTQEALENYYKTLSAEQLSAVESVSMDMWPAYINATQAHVPDALNKIAFDKFHVAKYLGDAVDKVRRAEHRLMQSAGSDILKGSKYDWLTNPENMDRARWQGLQNLMALCQKTARAWAIKECAMSLWHYVSRTWAEKAWKRWLGWALRSQLEPVRKAAKTIQRHLYGIINAIVLKANNGMAESINAKIQKVKTMACGFRNRERFRNAIYFHLGGLDLYPKGASPSV